MIAGFLAALLTVSAPLPPAAALDRAVLDDGAQDAEGSLYKAATASLDRGDWREAERAFGKIAALKGEKADAALYWRAYAFNKMAMRNDALTTLRTLFAAYPQSTWRKDAKALALEIRQSSGQAPSVDVNGKDDEELKLLALSGLMNADAEKALPLIKNMLAGSPSPGLRDRALFVLAQSGSPEARQTLLDIAKSSPNEELQTQAIRNLGLFGGKEGQQTLVDIYSSSPRMSARKAVLQALMLSGDRARIAELARKEPSPELRREAINQLGVMGGRDELWQIYQTDKDMQVRRGVLNALFVAGAASQLGELALKETDPELRRDAIQKLGLTGPESAATLKSLYTNEKDPSVKRAVLDAYFVQGNAKALIEIARQEQDPALKRAAVEKLSVMGSKEAGDYMMELLK
jgi:HEAT repeat protein